jgi:hypothetical protein
VLADGLGGQHFEMRSEPHFAEKLDFRGGGSRSKCLRLGPASAVIGERPSGSRTIGNIRSALDIGIHGYS